VMAARTEGDGENGQNRGDTGQPAGPSCAADDEPDTMRSCRVRRGLPFWPSTDA
jgi:hypothetical protein